MANVILPPTRVPQTIAIHCHTYPTENQKYLFLLFLFRTPKHKLSITCWMSSSICITVESDLLLSFQHYIEVPLYNLSFYTFAQCYIVDDEMLCACGDLYERCDTLKGSVRIVFQIDCQFVDFQFQFIWMSVRNYPITITIYITEYAYSARIANGLTEFGLSYIATLDCITSETRMFF